MRKVWIDGQLVAKDDAKVSVYDHGLLYGDGCFEGIRAYPSASRGPQSQHGAIGDPDQPRIFKLRSHIRRLFESAEKIRLTPPYSADEIADAVRETVMANGLTDGAYIRLILTRGAGTLGLHPFRCPKPGTIIIVDTIQLYPPELYDRGMKVIVAKRPRIPMACLDPAIKSLNYLNNILAKIEAIDAEVLEAIMLNVDGYVAECTGDNIFYVMDNVIFTPSFEAGFLHGITRQFVIDTLAPALGYNVCEKLFRLDELVQADEVFLTGTAAEIIGVSQIDEHRIGSGVVGPVTKSLMDEFRSRVSGDALED